MGGENAEVASGGTCAGSPRRRASGTGRSPEVELVPARPPGLQPAPPQRCRPEPRKPPSSAAARVAEPERVDWNQSGIWSSSWEEGGEGGAGGR